MSDYAVSDDMEFDGIETESNITPKIPTPKDKQHRSGNSNNASNVSKKDASKKNKKQRTTDNSEEVSIAPSDSASQRQSGLNSKRDFSQILSDEVSESSTVKKLKEKIKKMDKFASFDLTPCLLPVKGNPGLGTLDDGNENGDDDDFNSNNDGDSDDLSNEDDDGMEVESDTSTKREKRAKQLSTCLEINQKHICKALRDKDLLQEIRNIISRECSQSGVTCDKIILAHVHYKKPFVNGPGKVKMHPSVPDIIVQDAAAASSTDKNNGTTTEMPPPKSRKKEELKKQCVVKVWIEFAKALQSESSRIPENFEVNTSFDLNRQKQLIFGAKRSSDAYANDEDELENMSDIGDDDIDDNTRDETAPENVRDDDAADGYDGTADIVGKHEIWTSIAFTEKRDVRVNNFTTKKLQTVYKELVSDEKRKRREKNQTYKSVYFWERDSTTQNWRAFRESKDFFTELLNCKTKSEMVNMIYDSNPAQAINNGNLNQKIDNTNMVKKCLQEKNTDKSQRPYTFPPHLEKMMQDPSFIKVRDTILLRRRVDQMIEEFGRIQVSDDDDSVEHIKQQFETIREKLNRCREILRLPRIDEELEEMEMSENGDRRARVDLAEGAQGMEVENPDAANAGAAGSSSGANQPGKKNNNNNDADEEDNMDGTRNQDGNGDFEEYNRVSEAMVEDLKIAITALRVDLRDFKRQRLTVFDEILTDKSLLQLISDLSSKKTEEGEVGKQICEVLRTFNRYELIEKTLPELDANLYTEEFEDLDDEVLKTLMHAKNQLDQSECTTLLVEKIMAFLEETRPPKPSNKLAKDREHEVNIVLKLKSWYDRDCIPVDMKRRRGLIIYSWRRGLGKTYLAQSFVNYDPSRFIMCSTRFTREQFMKNFMSFIHLLIIDDLAVDLRRQTDVEMLKKLLTGQPATIIDKYLNFDYDGGVPVILTTNDREMFLEMMKSPNFKEDCVFIELREYIGPPEFKQDSRASIETAITADTENDLANYTLMNEGGGMRGSRKNRKENGLINENSDIDDNESDNISQDSRED